MVELTWLPPPSAEDDEDEDVIPNTTIRDHLEIVGVTINYLQELDEEGDLINEGRLL